MAASRRFRSPPACGEYVFARLPWVIAVRRLSPPCRGPTDHTYDELPRLNPVRRVFLRARDDGAGTRGSGAGDGCSQGTGPRTR
ncbi:hypothetical protein GCM10010280_29830 [Streptomyces pilosus]|uniref:Uncharacterized protein n=1 Tax=Streptomyces pilosus TaxID=28893 RepID=A0A918EYJ9_9ACTN|nr:hypothetical protein GCM10010280_29830 [Streptomyces pilosus]